MNYVYLIILLSLAQFMYFTMRVGAARHKYGVEAPKTVGHDTWERVFRVQQNTMEQLIMFVPGMLGFAYYVSPQWALLPGVVYLIGRQLYGHYYVAEAKKRGPGASMSILSNVVLLLGAIIGLLIKLF